jgi:hypothetical protein
VVLLGWGITEIHTGFGEVRKSKGKTPLGRPSCRWEGNIKMNRMGMW